MRFNVIKKSVQIPANSVQNMDRSYTDYQLHTLILSILTPYSPVYKTL